MKTKSPQLKPVPQPGENPDNVVAMITQLEKVTDGLAETNALIEVMLENSPDCIYFKDCQSHFVHYSKSFEKHFNQGEICDLKGKSDFDFFAAEHAQS